MKNVIFILCTALPFICSAGGGGGLRPEAAFTSSKPEIVYHMGEQDGVVRFAYGSLVNNQWQIQKIYGRLDYLVKKADLITSLEESKNTHEWVQVK